MSSDIRILDANDCDDLSAILLNSYPLLVQGRKQCKFSLINEMKLDKRGIYSGIFKAGRLVGCIKNRECLLNLFGNKLRVIGLGGIAVDILHKKEGITFELMDYSLKQAYEKNINMAVITPFSSSFYVKMGFGFGSVTNQYRIKVHSMPKGFVKADLRCIEADDKRLLADYLDRYFVKTHGMLDTSDYELNGIFTGNNRVIGCVKDNIMTGYMVYNYTARQCNGINEVDMAVSEFMYDSVKDLSAMLAFIYSQYNQINDVIIRTQLCNFHYWLGSNECSCVNPNNTMPYESCKQSMQVMYRILNIRGLHKELKDHEFNAENSVLKLNIKDNLCTCNNGNFFMKFTDKKADILNTSNHFDFEITLAISSYTSMLIGAISFKELFMYGLAQISDIAGVDIVNAAFQVSNKPECYVRF